MPPEIEELFSDCTPGRFSVYRYCSSCLAHRLLKIGWEPQVNLLSSRRLVMLSLQLPVHCRLAIIQEAYNKALQEGNVKVLTLLRKHFDIQEKVAV
jgi:hypothetical protein